MLFVVLLLVMFRGAMDPGGALFVNGAGLALQMAIAILPNPIIAVPVSAIIKCDVRPDVIFEPHRAGFDLTSCASQRTKQDRAKYHPLHRNLH